MHLLRHRKIPREHDAYLEEMKMNLPKGWIGLERELFSRLAEIKNKRISEGKEVIDLSIGAPNIPPAEHIRKAHLRGSYEAGELCLRHQRYRKSC